MYERWSPQRAKRVRPSLRRTLKTRARGLYREEYVAKSLAAPNERSNLGINILFQLGLLELWLQQHVPGG